MYHNFTCPENFADYKFGLWMMDHPKFHQSDANVNRMDQYIAQNHLDPTEYRTYNRAFKALRRTGAIELNK